MSNIKSIITGQLLHAKTATFKDDNDVDQTYGKIQLMGVDMSGEFSTIENIKVRKEHFGWLPDIASLRGKSVTLDLEQSQYNGKVSYYLASPLKKTA